MTRTCGVNRTEIAPTRKIAHIIYFFLENARICFFCITGEQDLKLYQKKRENFPFFVYINSAIVATIHAPTDNHCRSRFRQNLYIRIIPRTHRYMHCRPRFRQYLYICIVPRIHRLYMRHIHLCWIWSNTIL